MTRSRRRSPRKTRISGSLAQPAWKQLRYHNSPTQLLGDDAVESIHQAALSILQETGMTILADAARDRYAQAGFDVDETSQRVRFGSELLESIIATAPASFTLEARNPAKNLRIGDDKQWWNF